MLSEELKAASLTAEACYKQASTEHVVNGEKHLEDAGRVASKRWLNPMRGAKKLTTIIICTTRYLIKVQKLTSTS